MIDIQATPAFMRQAKKWMSSEALQALIDELVMNPKQGVVIRGTGGIRKIRWQTGKGNQGKRGGLRVLYYYQPTALVLLLTLYRKSDKEAIDPDEKAQLKKLIPKLLEERR
ncbi:MAG: type II toxin-antitoxin system RelE/ParE family toxin [Gammaproteobacteria bacterium]|nr:type II toxin-antitoxin system RelE/ParE family toxin [Gammaproteobacteria bacterium]